MPLVNVNVLSILSMVGFLRGNVHPAGCSAEPFTESAFVSVT